MSPAQDAVPEVILGAWEVLRDAACHIRFAVFVHEQGVPAEMEVDEADPLSCHALAWMGDLAAGTGRLLPDGHVGRMAVLPAWRGRGVGRAVLTALMAEARRRGLSRLVLHAQTHAEGFYAGFGFVAEGEVFDDAGLPHRTMVWQVQG